MHSQPVIPYNPKLKAYASQLRRNMTLAEVLLWKHLKARQMNGYDFNRQRPIGEYIVDFYCRDLRLAIEIDGNSHDFKKEKDDNRQKALEKLGVRFLRFWDHDVKHDMQKVLGEIRAWIERVGEPTPPFGHPSEEGTRVNAVDEDNKQHARIPSMEGCPKGGDGSQSSSDPLHGGVPEGRGGFRAKAEKD